MLLGDDDDDDDDDRLNGVLYFMEQNKVQMAPLTGGWWTPLIRRSSLRLVLHWKLLPCV